MGRVLLEIGSEEIPARFLPVARRDIEEQALRTFGDYRISVGDIRTFATPRRIAVVIDGVSDAQESLSSEVMGPPKSAAFDSDGKPTKAALGFAGSQNASPEDLVIRKKGKGEYVAAVVRQEGQPSVILMPEILKEIVKSLRFPKSMRWGYGSFRFARPVHWILALHNDKPVRFEIEGVDAGGSTSLPSGDKSFGHRFLSKSKDGLKVKKINSYESVLEKHSVIVDPDRRMQMIAEQSAGVLNKGESVVPDEELLETVAYLVESPRAVAGGFSSEYLKLPDELLTAVMKGHQKYFSVGGAKGGLTNRFIIVSNTITENDDVVRRGAERVIRARFDDAKFYYEDDIKRPLESRVEDLKSVTFQDRLGSLYDKTKRMEALSARVADAIAPKARGHAVRAALLAKTDLVSGVVYEFPELQGIIGRYYASNDGEEKAVSEAIEEHYMPAFAGDRLPVSDAGAVVSLADRLDNLAAFFAIGLTPTGSEDPFALRRQALGVIAVLAERGYPASVRQLMSLAIEGLGEITAPAGLIEDVLGFVRQRLEGFISSRGYDYELVQSVSGIATEVPLSDVFSRLEAIRAFQASDEYNGFLAAIKRVRNITPEAELPPHDESLLSASEENDLAAALAAVRAKVEASLQGGDYEKALKELSDLTGPINKFFDKVLVMDKDERVKQNRLGLLSGIWALASQAADFSSLRETQ